MAVIIGVGTLPSKKEIYAADDLDLRILEDLICDARTTFKELAIRNKIDQRTIAKRFEQMVKTGVIRRVTVDIDWSRLGLTAFAVIGTRTSAGEIDRKNLFDYIRMEPRITECHTTIGAHEYLLKVVDRNISTLRTDICESLEPLTAELSTSLITETIKSTDHVGLFEYLQKTLLKQTQQR